MPAVKVDDVILGYRVTARVGRGSFGAVWRAEHALLGDAVAIKVLDPALGADRIEALLGRGRELMRLRHETIVDIKHVSDDPPALIMEHCEGRSLDQVAASGLTLEALAPLAAQLFTAVRRGHERDLLHLDLKPRNVLVDADGCLRVLDFGLFGLLEAPKPSAYMPPEQLAGDKVDQRADVFALGALLYGALSGRPAFRGDERGLPPRLPGVAYVNEVLFKAMALDRRERYYDVPELEAAFKLAVEMTSMGTPTPKVSRAKASRIKTPRAPKAPKRRKKRVVVRAPKSPKPAPRPRRAWLSAIAPRHWGLAAAALVLLALGLTLKTGGGGGAPSEPQPEALDTMRWPPPCDSAEACLEAARPLAFHEGIFLYAFAYLRASTEGDYTRAALADARAGRLHPDEAREAALSAACEAEPLEGGGLACGAYAFFLRHRGEIKRAITAYESCCLGGNPACCEDLGDLYAVEGREHRAKRAREQACAAQHQWACYDLAWMRHAGQAYSKDTRRAVEALEGLCRGGLGMACEELPRMSPDVAGFLDEACSEGHRAACSARAWMHAEGAGGVANPSEAQRLWSASCKAGYAKACRALGRVNASQRDYARACELGDGLSCARRGQAALPRAPREAARWLERGAALGSIPAYAALGRLYLTPGGATLSKEPERAARALLGRACGGGDPAACLRVGELELEGQPELALADVARACEMAHPEACLRLSALYQARGMSVKAEGVLRGACEVGQLEACRALGGAGGLRTACERGQTRVCYEAGAALRDATPPDLEGARALFERGCAASDAASCWGLGVLHREGLGVPADVSRAIEHLSKACAGAHAAACNELGLIYDEGRGVPVDDVSGASYYRRACALGSASGCYNEGLMLRKGEGVAKDLARARQRFEGACRDRHNRACFKLGVMLRKGEGGAKDPGGVIERFNAACEGGYLEACASLGVYLRGLAPEALRDVDRARVVLERACDGEVRRACNQLGLIFDQGEGSTPKDEARGFALFERACRLGYGGGCSNMGITLQERGEAREAYARFDEACRLGFTAGCRRQGLARLKGEGIEGEVALGEAQLQRLCEVERHAYACRELGHARRQGWGLSRDLTAARRFYAQGCDHGSGLSCDWLGALLRDGKGGARDYAAARERFEEGCRLGQASACTNVGHLYRRGQGVPRNLVEARARFQRGCDGGHGGGCDWLGYMHREGAGGGKDLVKARAIFERGCALKHHMACTNLATMLKDGKGGPKELKRALKHYRFACPKRASACNGLGYMYANAVGVDKDERQGRLLYEQACQGAHALGCANAGWMHEHERGGGQKARAAYYYGTSCGMGRATSCEEARQLLCGEAATCPALEAYKVR